MDTFSDLYSGFQSVYYGGLEIHIVIAIFLNVI